MHTQHHYYCGDRFPHEWPHRKQGVDLNTFLQQLVVSGGYIQVSCDSAGGTNNNPLFNEVLFGKYINLKVDSNHIKSRDNHNKTSRGICLSSVASIQGVSK